MIDCTNSATLAQLVLSRLAGLARPGRLSRSARVAALPLFFSSAVLSGCGAEPPKPVEPAAPVDEWANLSKSSQWLHAMGDSSGSHKEECVEIEKWVLGESECQASSCENGRDLARDWLAHCTKILPAGVTRVKDALTRYEERASQPDSACSAELKPILAGKCGADKTCEAAAQRWSTRCAGKEGSPLAARILARFVQRRIKEPRNVELDLRTCEDLRAEVAAGLTCEHKFKCEDSVSKIELYRARCEDEGDRPPLAFALLEMSIFAAAEHKAEPLLAVADTDAEAPLRATLPPALADGTGVLVNVCGARVATLDAYLTARKECESGAVVFARAFKLSGGFEVRLGQVPAGDTATFVARYPSLLLAGERERFDKERIARFDAQLDAAAKLAAEPKTAMDGVRALLQLFRERGRDIYRTAAMHAAIKAKDASFIPAFKEIGKAKASAKGAKPELSSIALRGKSHALADLDEGGSVRFGAVSWGAPFDTSVLLPTAHEAYLVAMKPLLKKTAKDQPPEEVDADEARAFGALAEDCQTGAASAKAAEKSLLECAFGQRTCDDAQLLALQKTLESGRVSSENAFVAASIFQTTAIGNGKAFYKKIMATAQCEAPTW